MINLIFAQRTAIYFVLCHFLCISMVCVCLGNKPEAASDNPITSWCIFNNPNEFILPPPPLDVRQNDGQSTGANINKISLNANLILICGYDDGSVVSYNARNGGMLVDYTKVQIASQGINENEYYMRYGWPVRNLSISSDNQYFVYNLAGSHKTDYFFSNPFSRDRFVRIGDDNTSEGIFVVDTQTGRLIGHIPKNEYQITSINFRDMSKGELKNETGAILEIISLSYDGTARRYFSVQKENFSAIEGQDSFYVLQDKSPVKRYEPCNMFFPSAPYVAKGENKKDLLSALKSHIYAEVSCRWSYENRNNPNKDPGEIDVIAERISIDCSWFDRPALFSNECPQSKNEGVNDENRCGCLEVCLSSGCPTTENEGSKPENRANSDGKPNENQR